MIQYKNRSAIVKSNLILIFDLFLGIGSLFDFIMILVALKPDLTTDGIHALSLMLALGLFLTVKGFKRRALIKRFKIYVKFLSNDPQRSLHNLALATNRSLEKVKDDINLMIKKGYFKNAYIKEHTNCLAIGKPSSASSNHARQNVASHDNARKSFTSSNMTGGGSTAFDSTRKSTITSDVKISINQINYFNNMMPNEPEKRYKTGKCKGCGAPYKIPEGSVEECEYCGSYIK